MRKWCTQNKPTPKYKFVFMNCVELAVFHGKLLYAKRIQVLNSGEYHDHTHTHTDARMFIRTYHISTYSLLVCKCYVIWCVYVYRGADKTLALPGVKQAIVSVRMV